MHTLGVAALLSYLRGVSLDLLGGIADLAVAVVGLAGTGWIFFRWQKRPKFLCGIPPRRREQEALGLAPERLGKRSLITAFSHAPHCFAERLRRGHRIEVLTDEARQKLLARTERCRTIQLDENGRAKIPVLFANTGGRVAANYTATMTLYAEDGGVHVTDVVAETLKPWLYLDRPELLERDVAHADPEIVEMYDDYMMEVVTHWGDVVVLEGNLEAYLYELVLVSVLVEERIEDFAVVFTVDCSDGWAGVQTYIQGCRVDRSAERATSVEAPPPAAAAR